MKYLFAILLSLIVFNDLDKIAKVNRLKKEAKEAYLKGDYPVAIEKYRYLIDSLDVEDDNITLNLASAYYNTQDTAQAISNYSSLLASDDRLVKSTANQQMGVISTRHKKFDESLDYFKQALRADPQNEDARYNYELVKKILKEQEEEQQQQNQNEQNQENEDQEQKEEQQQDQQNQNQQNQSQDEEQQGDQEQEQQDKEGVEREQISEDQQQKEDQGEPKDKEEQNAEAQDEEESEQQEGEDQMNSVSEKLEELKISEEKAQMILEALKNKEIQYYQQNQRKATKRKDPKKPDW